MNSWATPWRIKLQDLNRAHTVVFNGERDLLEVFSLNPEYSSGDEVNMSSLQYNFDDIEECIEDRWLVNKPLIDYESSTSVQVADDRRRMALPTVVYIEDVSLGLNFVKLRSKVKQEPLPPHIFDVIYTLNIELSQLNDLIQDLQTAVNLLMTMGGEPEEKLEDVMKNRLGMENPLAQNSVLRNQCLLKHVERLWRMLCYRQALELKRRKYDPFAHVSDCLKKKLPDNCPADLPKRVFPNIVVPHLMEAVYFTIMIRQSSALTSGENSQNLNWDGQLKEELKSVLRLTYGSESNDSAAFGDVLQQSGLNLLPEDVKVCHCVDLFNIAYKYTERTASSS